MCHLLIHIAGQNFNGESDSPTFIAVFVRNVPSNENLWAIPEVFRMVGLVLIPTNAASENVPGARWAAAARL
jgi:glutathione synthase/RimK-type ligase-like ATP-grasp enzyme